MVVTRSGKYAARMKGQIFKIHSDFYYTNTPDGVFECKIREILKKQKEKIFVGDFVELEQVNFDSKQAFILKVLERDNYIPRPKVANIDRIIIVSALKEPDIDFEQLNRYLCFCEYYKIKPLLCFNKNDLAGEEEGSWKSRLESEGYGTEVHLTGLGELDEVADIFIDHCKQASPL